MIGYLLALLPLYFLVYLPLTSNTPSTHTTSFNAPIDATKLNASILALDDNHNTAPLACPPHTYTTHILSTNPLVVYIKDFLSPDERAHLLASSLPLYEPSLVWNGGHSAVDPTVRVSDNALLPRDTTVRCIERRALAFQGWRSQAWVERLRTQRYGPGGHYTHHFDHAGTERTTGRGRISSFMVYVGDECTGGGTEFPRLLRPIGEEWCKFIECQDSAAAKDDLAQPAQVGVTFKPRAGNAVFWENLRSDGTGYEDIWHAGLPVRTGEKVGLNIWTWGRI